VIIDARRGDIGVTKPFLHFGDVGLVIECVGRGRCAQRMRADLEAKTVFHRPEHKRQILPSKVKSYSLIEG